MGTFYQTSMEQALDELLGGLQLHFQEEPQEETQAELPEMVQAALPPEALPELRLMHSVYFLDSSGKLIGEPLRAAHGEAVAPPAWCAPAGEVFLAWSQDTSCITGDTYCVALTEDVPEPKSFGVTFYDAAGFALDEVIIEENTSAGLPDYAPPAGFRFLGWECFSLSGKNGRGRKLGLLQPGAACTQTIICDCKFCAKCEPIACHVLVMDYRSANPMGLISLGNVGYGAVLTQEDLTCLHLRHTDRLRPFRVQITSDTLLALTQLGVRAFDQNMRPLEMLELVHQSERETPRMVYHAEERMRREA